jgi:uncharacterized protein involved in exopolysaccharide biosynthesis
MITDTVPSHIGIATNGTGGSSALRDILYAVFKHKRLVVGIFVAVVSTAVVAVFLRPAVWKAQAKVLVKVGEELQLAPSDSAKVVTVPLSALSANTEAELVRSREVLVAAVEHLGIKPGDGTTLEQMIEGMRPSLTVTPVTQSNVLQLEYRGRDPERAAEVLNAVADAYVAHHQMAFANSRAGAVYDAHRERLAKEMLQAEENFRAYLEREGITQVKDEIRLTINGLNDNARAQHAQRAKISGYEERGRLLDAAIEAEPQTLTTSTEYVINPVLRRIGEKIVETEAALAALRVKYTDTDRHVLDKEQELAALRRQLTVARQQVVGRQTVSTNEQRRLMRRSSMTLRNQLHDFRIRLDALARRGQELEARLLHLRGASFVIGRLKEEIRQKRYALDLYTRRLEEARVGDALDNQGQVAVTVIQRAHPPLKSEGGRFGPIIMSLLAGLGLSTATAIGLEFLNRSLRFEDDVERYLELPVLAVIPDLHGVEVGHTV